MWKAAYANRFSGANSVDETTPEDRDYQDALDEYNRILAEDARRDPGAYNSGESARARAARERADRLRQQTYTAESPFERQRERDYDALRRGFRSARRALRALRSDQDR